MICSEHLVVDASALLAVLLPETHTAQARRLLGDALELAAPDLLLFETTAVLAKRAARGDLSAEDAETKRQEACDFPVVTTPARDLSELAFALARRLDHSAYDCFYLALAVERDCLLLTGDRALAESARKQGLGRFVRLLGSVESEMTSE